MYGGAVSIVGFVSLLFNYVKRACCLILDKMGSIGFPATLDKVQNSTVEKVDYLEQAARGIPWIYASAIVLLIGLIWLICDIVRRKKSAT